jgi:aspartate/methionine/tyrosine aminotransferase
VHGGAADGQLNVLDISVKARRFSESVIREMTRLSRIHDAINLAQGCPDFPAPAEVKEAARRAIAEDLNQYTITWGSHALRAAISEKYARHYGMEADPSREITVTCGSTEAMIASILAVLDPGDELVVFEPYYENYGPDAILAGAVPRFVPLRPPDFGFDPDELAAAFNERTRGIVLNSPNNPTGKVFSREELEAVADLCRKWDVVAFSDEIYEHIVYDGAEHVPIATLPGMADRTVTISALSKTYSVTGWRVGWAVASPTLTAGIRKVHDFLTVGAPAPLQEAGTAALALPDDYYRDLAEAYRARRDLMIEGLLTVGFECARPRGAYYVLADAKGLGVSDDAAFARRLVEEVGVACVPGSSFYSEPERGRSIVRFSFCKKEETLREAIRRLEAGLAN